MPEHRHYSLLDQICLSVDQALRAISANAKTTQRHYPADKILEADLTHEQRKHSASLMRVNHAGEVCAQALYHGQSLASRRGALKTQLQQAAIEEGDHLTWCNTRLTELGSHSSYLNPLWYTGSFLIGLSAGVIGDKWSLGFLAETEHQVVNHLEKHLSLVPKNDYRSLKIVEQMREDEANHRDDALTAGAAVLPHWVKQVMKLSSKVMVKVAYWI